MLYIVYCIHLTAHQPPLLQASQQLFVRKMLPQSARGIKCLPGVHQIPKHKYLCYRNKQTSFLLAKMCVLVILVSILINKDVFEPSYNALNFMICTILDLHQPNIIIIIGILEKRKWRSREATQAISGRSKI